MKTCSRCHRTKKLSEFSKDKRMSDSLRSYCKECAKKYRVNLEKKREQEILEFYNSYKKKYGYEYKKVCKICNIEKDLHSFHKHKISKDGLAYHCKNCSTEKGKEYREKNKEKLLNQKEIYIQQNKELVKKRKKEWAIINKKHVSIKKSNWYKNNKKRVSIRMEKWNKEHKEEVAIKKKYYYFNNKSLISKKHKIYRDKNPEIMRANRAKKRATLKLCTPPWYNIQRKEIISLYKKAIQLTQRTGISYHIDHIYPLIPKNPSEPVGLHVLANLQILTAEENIKKSNMQPEEWEQRKKELRLDFPHATLYM